MYFLLKNNLKAGINDRLTHISLASHFWVLANGADPDQTPQNAASDKGLHCLLTGISIQNRTKMKKIHLTPLKCEMDGKVH